MDNNNKNNVYANKEILNLFFINGKCAKVPSRTYRMFNENYPHLPPMIAGKEEELKKLFCVLAKQKQIMTNVRNGGRSHSSTALSV